MIRPILVDGWRHAHKQVLPGTIARSQRHGVITRLEGIIGVAEAIAVGCVTGRPMACLCQLILDCS